MLLAIDPGACSGWAIASDKKITYCGVIDYRDGGSILAQLILPIPRNTNITSLVIEVPQIYKHSKGDPQDLITLAILAGRLISEALFQFRGIDTITLVKPAEWKGQLKKDVCSQRTWDRLSEKEQSVVSAGGRGIAQGKVHNMMDAVGIALYAVGRGR